MPETIRCPDCGAANDATATACTRCNFPLAEGGAPRAATAPDPAPAKAAAGEPAPAEPVAAEPTEATAKPFTFDPGPKPVRRRRPRSGAMQPVQVQLWLITAAAVVIAIVYFAAQGFWRSNVPPVEGARPDQQQRAELARQALERDSTNLEARVELANVLYDTGNWSEAIVHYRSAERLDPKRATVVVDLGVCYYNLGHFASAESLFHRALSLEPEQVFALFNLGIVAESREQWDAALDFYHRAMRAGPPEAMKPALEQHMQAVMTRTGKKAPPLP
jgi:tetratricopeptide (TPR) repeat protein